MGWVGLVVRVPRAHLDLGSDRLDHDCVADATVRRRVDRSPGGAVGLAGWADRGSVGSDHGAEAGGGARARRRRRSRHRPREAGRASSCSLAVAGADGAAWSATFAPAKTPAAARLPSGSAAVVPAELAAVVERSLSHGHVAVVAYQLGLPGLLGPAGRYRDWPLS